jgi:hypothetical protein
MFESDDKMNTIPTEVNGPPAVCRMIARPPLPTLIQQFFMLYWNMSEDNKFPIRDCFRPRVRSLNFSTPIAMKQLTLSAAAWVFTAGALSACAVYRAVVVVLKEAQP